MSYKYELKINGIIIKTKTIQFRPNVLALLMEDMPKFIKRDMAEEVSFHIKKLKR